MVKPVSDIEFAELLRQHQATMFGFVRSLVLHAEDAQDVYQETVLALWQQQANYDAARPFGPWAIGVAKNKAYDYFKAKQGEKLRFSDELLSLLAEKAAEPQSTSEESRELALRACLTKLSSAQRTLLRRYYERGEPIAEVAASLDRTPGSVYSSLHHIRGRLLKCIRSRLRGGQAGG